MATGGIGSVSAVSKKRGKKSVAGSASKATKKRRKKKLAKNHDRVVVLDGTLSIREVVTLKESLTATLKAAGPVVIDASRVEAADTAALQLLAAFANSARGQLRSLEWREPSAALQELAALLDLEAGLGLAAHSTAVQVENTCPVF